ncbi:FecCD family ABC transporter permease [Candidatus Methanomassiliicoccus intestinalis]|uniref:FecCD family ABC transporter permease n=1 Tax=Candidatus Methanomassiliicoccus intestinalis TaxID=1406512 RepID=UPI0037DD8452
MLNLKFKNALRNAKVRMRISGSTLNRLQSPALPENLGSAERVVYEYRTYKHAKHLFLLGFLALFFILIGLTLGIGAYSISFTEVYKIIFDSLWEWIRNWNWGEVETIAESVVWDQRMPQTLTAIFVGIGLAVAGTAMQSMMKNPLADPYTTGISSGAAFGATLAITMGISVVSGYFGRIINSFIFAMVPALLILLLSRYRRPSPAMMILTGISIMYIFNAVQSFMMLRADPNAASAVYTWTVGSITTTGWSSLPFIIIVVIVGSVAIQLLTKTLNAMNSGDSYAKSLGIDVDGVRIVTMIIVSLLAAGIVSFTGIIGFVGLVAPHIARIFVGSDNRILVPAAALMGACLMIFADITTYFISPFELPVGIVTALIGGPLFMILILRQKKEIW